VTDPLHGLARADGTLDRERFRFNAALGPGVLLDSGLPGVVFFVVWSANGQAIRPALWAAVAVGALLGVVRLARRDSLQNVVAGFMGLLVAAFVVSRTGRPQDIALPGLLVNVGYALAYLVSIAVRKPLLGFAVGAVSGDLTGWLKDPRLVRAYTLASWLWVAMFVVRLAVQVPLYLAGADQLGWLVTARLVMGWPLFALNLWLSWLIIRRALRRPLPAEAQPA
jgi:hypothetical protein